MKRIYMFEHKGEEYYIDTEDSPSTLFPKRYVLNASFSRRSVEGTKLGTFPIDTIRAKNDNEAIDYFRNKIKNGGGTYYDVKTEDTVRKEGEGLRDSHQAD